MSQEVPERTLRALVAVARPALAGAPIAFLGDGCDHDNFLVDGRFVLRLPKNAEVEKRLITEIALLGRLDVTLDTPCPTGPFRDPAHPHAYALYPFLEGVPGDVAATFDQDHAAMVLGALLGELHHFDVGEAARLGVREDREPVARWLEVIRRSATTASDVLERLPPHVLDAARLPAQRRMALLHADLGGEHVLVDPASGRVTGVIDWADAIVGDPAIDYAGLLGWRGEAFLVEALESAAIPFDEDDLVRARFFSAAVAIHSIALGRRLGKAGWVTAGERVIERQLP